MYGSHLFERHSIGLWLVSSPCRREAPRRAELRFTSENCSLHDRPPPRIPPFRHRATSVESNFGPPLGCRAGLWSRMGLIRTANICRRVHFVHLMISSSSSDVKQEAVDGFTARLTAQKLPASWSARRTARARPPSSFAPLKLDGNGHCGQATGFPAFCLRSLLEVARLCESSACHSRRASSLGGRACSCW